MNRQARKPFLTCLPDFAFHPRWEKAAILFLILTTLLRLAALPAMELVPDEAYYWDWSRHLSLGYYDQGPLIAYVIRLTTALFGTNEFGVRIGVLLASLGTLLCAYVLAKRLFSPLTGFITLLLLGLTPLMEVGSLIATYDPLMVFFWALTVVYLERALFASTEIEQRASWLKAGFATGLGFLSKHTMLFILPCLFVFLLLSPRHRIWLRRPLPYLAFLLTPLLYSGVFWWNAHHHWWTFGHLLFLTQKINGTPLKRLGNFVGSQALLLGPGLFVAGLVACIRAILPGKSLPPSESVSDGTFSQTEDSLNPPLSSGKRERSRPPAIENQKSKIENTQACFLACMGLPIFVLFCLLSLKSKVQGNWAANAWVTPPILWAAWMTEWMGRSSRSARSAVRWIGGVAAFSLFIVAIILIPTLRTSLGIRLKPWDDTSNTAMGWRLMAARVQQSRQEMEREGNGPVFLVSNGYQICAELAFYLPDHPLTQDMFLHHRLTMYAAYVEDLKQHLGGNALFIAESEEDTADLRQLFESVEWEPPFEIWRRPLYNIPIRTIHIARCRNYRRYIGYDWAEGG